MRLRNRTEKMIARLDGGPILNKILKSISIIATSIFMMGNLGAYLWVEACLAEQVAEPQPIANTSAISKNCDCKCLYRRKRCDAFKASLPVNDQINIGICETSPTYGKKAWEIVRGCSHGASDIVSKPILQILDLPSSIVELRRASDRCNGDTFQKFAMLQPVEHMYSTEMKNIMLDKWNCADIAREVNNRIEVIEKNLNAKRIEIRDGLLNSGKNVNVDDPEVTAKLLNEVDAKYRTYLEKQEHPKAQDSHWECYTPEGKARIWCEGLGNAFLAGSGAYGISKMAAAKQASETAESMKAASLAKASLKENKEAAKGVISADGPTFKEITPIESEAHGIRDPNLKTFLDERSDLMAEIERSPDAKEFLKSSTSKFDPSVDENWQRWIEKHPPDKADENLLAHHRGIGYELNEFLRGNLEKNPEVAAAWTADGKGIERALLNRPTYDGVVFRRTDMPEAVRSEFLKPGNVVSDKGFMSATYDGAIKKVASSRAFWKNAEKQENGVFLFIKSKTGRLADEAKWEYHNEAEVIFLPRTHFRVNAVIYKDGISYVFMSEI